MITFKLPKLNSSLSSSDATTTAKAKHVGVRQPPLDAVAAEQDLDERHEDARHDALVADVFATTRGQTHQRPLRQ